ACSFSVCSMTPRAMHDAPKGAVLAAALAEVGPTKTATTRPERRRVSPQAHEKASHDVAEPSIPTTTTGETGTPKPSPTRCAWPSCSGITLMVEPPELPQ